MSFWHAGKVGVLVALMLGFSGVAMLLDFDADGRTNGQEVAAGTRGLNPDSDADGLGDGDEWHRGTDPLEPDMDGDGVLDGAEGAVQCVVRRDCDQDGLPDGSEVAGFDPLDPDTYDVGLSDSVVAAFEAAGQPASRDLDQDGIPDGWESEDGLIAWGGFNPQPNQRDLLVEFIRVEGPDSGRFNLNFDPAYNAVAAMFGAQGIALSWQETIVSTAQEHRPGFLTEDDIGYYDDVLGDGASSLNPFVTTIVLNPQQTQEDLAGDILGAAFLRSMIATLDYGAHTVLTFEEDESNGITIGSNTIDLKPVMESHILDARVDQIEQIRFGAQGIVDLGSFPNGDVFLVTRDSGNDFRWRWTPDWYATAPNITLVGDPSIYLQLRLDKVRLQTDNLASTIAHELGHTLGLCHSHEVECYSKFDPADISLESLESTTMSYWADSDALHFLPSEWAQVDAYLRCPPQAPVGLVASDASPEELLDAKYYASFVEVLELRQCGDAEPVVADLPPAPGANSQRGALWVGLYATGGLGTLALVAWRT